MESVRARVENSSAHIKASNEKNTLMNTGRPWPDPGKEAGSPQAPGNTRVIMILERQELPLHTCEKGWRLAGHRKGPGHCSWGCTVAQDREIRHGSAGDPLASHPGIDPRDTSSESLHTHVQAGLFPGEQLQVNRELWQRILALTVGKRKPGLGYSRARTGGVRKVFWEKDNLL